VNGSADLQLLFIILTNLALVGSSRLATCIKVASAQGVVVGLLPLVLPGHELSVRLFVLSFLAVSLKGILFPWLLLRALRLAGVRHEVEPYVSYPVSLLGAVLALGLSLWLAPQLNPAVSQEQSQWALPGAAFTALVGLFLIVSRKNALNQVTGYLVLENGVYLFGIALALEAPFLVEMGVLLDVVMAVFVMGILVFQIHREFDHIEVDQLSSLKD
jgi:hydrogenase-4 component E